MSSVPSRISRYEIQGLIAQGGMGDLYLARDPNTSRLVILKLLNGTLDSTDLRERFEREARSLASLNHPNIVHIYDYGDFKGAPFIVMEYLRGETLAEKISRRPPLPLAQKLKWMTELCAGLAQAHDVGIIHRDVKPANLMVDQDERLKILDFGIARVADSNLTRVSAVQANLQIGTPGYMSPEQIAGGDIDARADVFGAGAVCYELLAYREAFGAPTLREIERKVLETQPEPLTAIVADVDADLNAVVMRALAKDPKDRPRDATALGDALENCLRRLAPDGVKTQIRRPSPGESRRGGSRGDAAFERAKAAAANGSREASRRFAIEALAEDPGHAGARDFLARVAPGGGILAPALAAAPATSAAARPPTSPSFPAPHRPPSTARAPMPAGPTDETVLIRPAAAPASFPPLGGPSVSGPESVDPTVLITRAELNARGLHADETMVGVPVDRSPRAGHVDSTMASTGKGGRGPAEKKKASNRPSVFASFAARWKQSRADRRSRAAAAALRRGPSRPRVSGRAIVVGLAIVAVSVAVVLGFFRLGGWLGTSGKLLTITRPTGGTITGGGINCGTSAANCTATLADGDPVELVAIADDGFVLTGFTGDCAPTGRTTMAGERRCGATFDPVETIRKEATWTLTITPPTGGTIQAAGDIKCGTMGTQCTAEIPAGLPVRLYPMPDTGFRLVAFTDECAPNGETTMTSARRCGATFAPSLTGERPASVPVTAPAGRGGSRSSPPITDLPKSPPVAVAGAAPAPAPTTPEIPPAPVATKVDDKPPITAEMHAKEEIPKVLALYCDALSSRVPDRVREVFPSASRRDLEQQWRQYKSLLCTLAEAPPLKYVSLSPDTPVGTAKVEVGMKQVQTMQTGGAPSVKEYIVTVTLSRPIERSVWHIDSVLYREKPKP